jgi:hypothetical protein
VKYFNLIEYYKTLFVLTNTKRLSLFEIQEMYPWEYEIYIQMLNEHLELENQMKQDTLNRERLQ